VKHRTGITLGQRNLHLHRYVLGPKAAIGVVKRHVAYPPEDDVRGKRLTVSCLARQNGKRPSIILAANGHSALSLFRGRVSLVQAKNRSEIPIALLVTLITGELRAQS
jgi:hypothetical protein